jgi:regulator of cell morphogenesis and NO signaling
MADVIHSNYLLIPVINRFGIKLGFGEKRVSTVCAELNIDVDFFLAIINAYNDANFFPAKRLQSFKVLLIVEYLRKTHQYYRETQLPLIEQLLSTLLRRSSKGNPRLSVLMKLFRAYKAELLAHLDREESITFPYVEEICSDPSPRHRSRGSRTRRRQAMSDYEAEHDDLDEKLYDLKNILIKYVGGEYDHGVANMIVFELFRLEKDVQDHVRIENRILLPLVKAVEESGKKARG